MNRCFDIAEDVLFHAYNAMLLCFSCSFGGSQRSIYASMQTDATEEDPVSSSALYGTAFTMVVIYVTTNIYP